MYDVIVIGLGGMGSAAAYQLAQRGQRVLGIERFTPAHAQGSSHGRSRIIRQAYFEDPAYVPLLQRSYELWEALARDSGHDVLTITGGLMLGASTSQTVTGSLRSARAYNLAHEVLDAADIRRRFPAFVPGNDDVALYEARAGFVHPELSVWAHVQLALHHGADLHFGEQVLHYTSDDRGVTVKTTRGTYHAGRLVLTPGPWAPQLMAELALPLSVTRQTLYWFEPTHGTDPFAIGTFPIYIWELDDGDQIYGFPFQPEVPGVKIGFFYRGPVVDPDAVNRIVTDDAVAGMRAAIAARIPQLNGALVNTATCLYTEVPDHHFIIAPHPERPNVIIGSPCSGHGYKFCSVVGEILADLAIHGETHHPIALFDPARLR